MNNPVCICVCVCVCVCIYEKSNIKIQRMLATFRSGIFCLTIFNSRIRVKLKLTLTQATKVQLGEV